MIDAAAPPPIVRADLQAWYRAFVQAHPRRMQPLPLADEGKPAWDCKGFVAMAYAALLDKGVSADRLWSLVVDGGAHIVLEVDLGDHPVVLDNLSPWLQQPSDYQVTLRRPAAEAFMAIAMAGGKAP